MDNIDPITVDSLSFTSRKENGCIDWFDVDHPDKDSKYDWHKQYERGIAFAKEFLKFKKLPNAELNGSELGWILTTIARKAHVLPDGLYIGFFQGVSCE